MPREEYFRYNENRGGKMGVVRMYDEEFVIDKRTGLGFEQVIKKIEPLINKWASTIRFGDMPFEDRRQEIYIIALNGIQNFDETKETKLSTFLHTHIKNKILSKIKSINKKSNNANYYHTDHDGFIGEIPASHINTCQSGVSDDENLDIYNIVPDNSSYSRVCDEEIIMSEVKNLMSDTDFKIVDMLRNGSSIKDIGEELDMNYWTVSGQIKKIKKSKIFREYE
jgi:RNA polymerase sigma factor (sigma-70 family)